MGPMSLWKFGLPSIPKNDYVALRREFFNLWIWMHLGHRTLTPPKNNVAGCTKLRLFGIFE